jgi:tetratricopeptide (TPR) repeat protein
MNLRGNRFQPRKESPGLRIGWLVVYTALIVVLAGVFHFYQAGKIRPLFSATLTPTLPSASYLQQGQVFFDAGQLDDAIAAYKMASQLDPKNASLLTELARIQTYSSDLLITDADRSARLRDALTSVDRAIQIAPDVSQEYAIQALVLDWSADPTLVSTDQGQTMLAQANQAAVHAIQLEPRNPLALAFQAEVLADQLNWSQALDIGGQAVSLAPDSMDVHRAYAKVLETSGDYDGAIQEYLKAIQINPNLPFLYLSLGVNYRFRKHLTAEDETADAEKALEAYATAARLNPNNPLPYLSIASTYANEGQFFIAEVNAQTALKKDPTNADIYGRLGVIYYRARNYEGSLPVLKCAVLGCTGAENVEGNRLTGQSLSIAALPLSPSTISYFYTYGSALAYYGQCLPAEQVFSQIRASPWDDRDVEAILRVGEAICSNPSTPTSPAPPSPYPATATPGP